MGSNIDILKKMVRKSKKKTKTKQHPLLKHLDLLASAVDSDLNIFVEYNQKTFRPSLALVCPLDDQIIII
jgi:hypothetical protein